MDLPKHICGELGQSLIGEIEMTNIERTFLTIWISLVTVALVVFLVLLFKGEIAKEPSYLSIDNLILCNDERLMEFGTEDVFYLQGNKLVFCGNLVTDSPIYLVGYLFYETTDQAPIGKFNDLETYKSGPLSIEIITSADIAPGKYIFQIYQARKIIAEYTFLVRTKE